MAEVTRTGRLGTVGWGYVYDDVTLEVLRVSCDNKSARTLKVELTAAGDQKLTVEGLTGETKEVALITKPMMQEFIHHTGLKHLDFTHRAWLE